MQPYSEEQAQAAFEQLRQLAEEAADAGDAGQRVLRAIEPTARSLQQMLGIGADGKLPVGAWSNLPATDKLDVQARLQGALDALRSATTGSDEPADPDNLMYRKHASNPWIIGLVIGSGVVVALVIWGIYRYWDAATSAKATESQVLRMVFLMGALGGAIHWMSSLVNFIGNGNLLRRWIPYYVLAPSQNGGPAQSLNLLGLYAFAGLTGLFAKQAIEMLRDVFAVLFKKIEAKDASGPVRQPAASAGRASSPQAAKGAGANK